MRAYLFAAVLLISTPAWALPVVSVDADPSMAGIQSVVEVPDGSSFDVDIVISGVEAGDPLNAFELDLLFDSSVLTATSVVDGGFLLDPVFQVQNIVGMVSVEFAEATLLPAGAVGSGVLATVSFDTAGLGTSVLDLENVKLSAPFGVRIPAAEVVDGSAVVEVIPEPGSTALFAMGALLVVSRVAPRRS